MKNKDWSGDSNSIFKTLGSSHHTDEERSENDYYATDPRAVRYLMEMHRMANDIWEPACGEGHLSKVMEEYGHFVKSTDLINRGFGEGGVNFLSNQIISWDGDIVTNPPYSLAKEFVCKAIDIIKEGRQVAMFLKLQFMEGKGRKDLFDKYPPKIIYVSRSRINCAKNGNFKDQRISGGSAVCYAWFVWEKGFKGDPIIKWFN